MERWVGKVALVTGVSSGIGAAIAEELTKKGLKVVGLARRVELVEELKKTIGQQSGELFPYKGDVSKKEDVDGVFEWIEKTFGKIHVLVNNAGIGRGGLIATGEMSNFEDVVKVNLLGLTACSQKAVQLMLKSGVNDGHIININSIAGHHVPQLPFPMFNIYTATKHGVTALTETLRQELRFLKTKIKVTSLSPGVVATDIGKSSKEATVGGQLPDDFMQYLMALPKLEPKDIADGVVYVLQTPPHVQVHELIIKPLGEPF